MDKIPEILSPAGNLEKLEFSLLYGADAVYCALDRFGMRSAAGNFTRDDYINGLEAVRRLGKKLYLTLNTMPHEDEIGGLDEYLDFLKQHTPDAFIIADPGIMVRVKNAIPSAVIHLSTQASTVNSDACRFWHDQGVKRIVLARELTLENIKKIRSNIPESLELEIFVHGSMCVSYSGRCLLSNYYVNRNANGGSCAQPCRWRYHLHEEKRPDDVLSAEEHPEGTYVFSSRDLCMVDHLDDLINIGVDSLKIEGRMKSAYYTACVTNAYRMALSDAAAGKIFDINNLKEVEGVSHREYCTGYFYTTPYDSANIVSNNEYLCEKAFLCTISEYDRHTGLARCIQRNKMTSGFAAQLLTPGKPGRDIIIGRLYDIDMNPIESTPHAKMEFFMEIPEACPGDILRGI